MNNVLISFQSRWSFFIEESALGDFGQSFLLQGNLFPFKKNTTGIDIKNMYYRSKYNNSFTSFHQLRGKYEVKALLKLN